jgi:hypothetical protein
MTKTKRDWIIADRICGQILAYVTLDKIILYYIAISDETAQALLS